MFELTGIQEAVRSTAREFAEKVLTPRVEEIEHAEIFPQDLINEMGNLGLMGIPYPEKYGGLDAGLLAETIGLEELAKISPSAAKLLTVCYLPMDAINLFGTDEQKERYLPNMCNGKDIGSLAFTEAGTGSDPKQLTTTAIRKNGKIYINGVKRFISNAAHKGTIVVVARDEGEDTCTAYLVKKFCKGYSLSSYWEKIGFKGSRVYDVFLDNVEVNDSDILGSEKGGFDLLIGTTAVGKLAFSAVFTGAAEGAYDLTRKYIMNKIHRDTSISKFPTVQLRTSTIAANTLSMKLMLYRAAQDAEIFEGNMRRVQAATALTKGYIADLSNQTIQACVNAFGAYGGMEEYKIERYLRDSVIFPNIEGNVDVQRLISGNYILKKDDNLIAD